MLLGGWRRRSALFTGDFRTGPSHKPRKGLGELTPGVCGDFGAQWSRRDGPTADLLHCAQTLRLEPHGCSASTHTYRRLIPHLFGIFRLRKLVGAFFAVPLPRAETGTGADGPDDGVAGPRPSRWHHGALWWSRRAALAASAVAGGRRTCGRVYYKFQFTPTGRGASLSFLAGRPRVRRPAWCPRS